MLLDELPMSQTIRLCDVAKVPWRNGGGVTQELLAWPSVSDWQLRVSVATIDRDGPFSAYPEVQRCFAVLQGGGVLLRFAEREERVHAGGEALAFDGADAPACDLLAGATLDLNLMVRNQAGQGQMQRARVDQAWTSSAPVRGLFTMAEARLECHASDSGAGNAKKPAVAAGNAIGSAAGTPRRLELEASTLYLDHVGAAQTWTLRSGSQGLCAYWLAFTPA